MKTSSDFQKWWLELVFYRTNDSPSPILPIRPPISVIFQDPSQELDSKPLADLTHDIGVTHDWGSLIFFLWDDLYKKMPLMKIYEVHIECNKGSIIYEVFKTLGTFLTRGVSVESQLSLGSNDKSNDHHLGSNDKSNDHTVQSLTIHLSGKHEELRED